MAPDSLESGSKELGEDRGAKARGRVPALGGVEAVLDGASTAADGVGAASHVGEAVGVL